MANKTVLEKVHDWLESNGYPLEYETQHVFDEAGFDAVQGFHVSDPKTGAAREIDVLVGSMRKTTDDRVINCVHVVECKTNKLPWVAFTRPTGTTARACIEQSIGTLRGRQAVRAWSTDAELRALNLFRQRDATAFSGSEARLGGTADPNAKDGCYSKLQQVISTSTLLATDLDSEPHVMLVFPVIVLSGELFAASYDMQARKMVVTEADEVRFQWRGAEALQAGHATIDVVRATRLPTWAAERKSDVDVLIKKLATVG